MSEADDEGFFEDSKLVDWDAEQNPEFARQIQAMDKPALAELLASIRKDIQQANAQLFKNGYPAPQLQNKITRELGKLHAQHDMVLKAMKTKK